MTETTTRFATLRDFYAARGGEFSGEADYGVWWTEGPHRLRGPYHRVSVVHATGDVYAFNFDNRQVELLGTLAPDLDCTPSSLRLHSNHTDACAYAEADRRLAGWPDQSYAGGLAWARERLR